jgi:hypothetical protein
VIVLKIIVGIVVYAVVVLVLARFCSTSEEEDGCAENEDEDYTMRFRDLLDEEEDE